MNFERRKLLIALCCCCLLGGANLSAQTMKRASGPGLYPPPLHISRISWRVPTALLPASAIADLRPVAQPKAWQYQDLALFCKLEVKMERAFRLPLRIRVGDVQYVDWLEGKRRSAY